MRLVSPRFAAALLPLLLLASPLAAPAIAAPLKVALIPVLDTLPLFVAEQNGYFREAGVAVTVVPVAGPVERDQLMQSGAVDGMLNELASTAVFNRGETLVRIVATARVARPDGPIFRILAAPKSGIAAPRDLAGVPIAVSKNTVIEYVTDRVLRAEGLAAAEIATASVPAIPERFQLLMEGKVRAATLPDPLASAALRAGALLVADDARHAQYSLSVLTFGAKSLAANGAAVRGFLAAWGRAVAEMNAHPDAYRELFLKKVRVPESVQATYRVPPFPGPGVPTRAQWEDATAWLREKGLLDGPVSYEGSVTAEYLPR